MPTTELVDQCLPTFTTNCGAMTSTTLMRPLYADELLWCMGVPSLERSAAAAAIPRWKFPVSTPQKVHMAGNGMHVPSVGLACLLSLCFVEPIVKET